MKKISCLLLSCILAISCGVTAYASTPDFPSTNANIGEGTYIYGNGTMTTKNTTVSGSFTNLSVKRIACKVIVTKSNSLEISYKIDSDLVDYISIKNINDTLEITSTKDIASGTGMSGITFYINMDQLNNISTSHMTNIKFEDQYNSQDVTINSGGNANLFLSLDCKNLTLNTTASLDLTLSGRSENFNVISRGNSKLNAENFFSSNTKITTNSGIISGTINSQNYSKDGKAINSVKNIVAKSNTSSVFNSTNIVPLNVQENAMANFYGSKQDVMYEIIQLRVNAKAQKKSNPSLAAEFELKANEIEHLLLKESRVVFFTFYEQFGLQYDFNIDRLYYNGQLVRNFNDIIVGTDPFGGSTKWPSTDGVLDVTANRNGDKSLTGLTESPA